MTQTGFDLQRAFEPSYNRSELMSMEGRMWLESDGRIDLIRGILRSVSDLSFVIWDLFVI